MEKQAVKNRIILFLIPVALFIVCSIVAPGFGANSISVVCSQAVIPVTLGYGIAFSSAAGIFDLSGGARMLLAASAGGYCATILGFGLPGLIAGSMLAGIFVSVVMGFAHNLLRIPSLILSLGFVMLIEVASARMLGESSFITIDSAIAFLGKPPYKYLVCLAMGILFYVLYYKTKFSCHVRLVGGNEHLAKNMGINPKKVNFMTFAIGGIFLGVVGILQISYAGAISASVSLSSLSLVFQPLMGVLIGMELLALYDNLAVTIVVGELCISILYNMIIAFGLPSNMQSVLLGVFMLIVMAISGNKAEIGALLGRKKSGAQEVSAWEK